MSVLQSYKRSSEAGVTGYDRGEPRKLVIINNSGWWYRARVNEYFERVFNESNGYSFRKDQVSSKTPKERNIEYITELSRAKFVICPPGIGRF